jgi:hypothetical protein
VWLTVSKKLLCPGCGDVIGDAQLRRWPGWLTIRSPDGYTVNPLAAGIARRIVDRELAEADDDTAADTARSRLQYVVRNITDPIYDLRCRRGHSTLQTAPQIRQAMLSSPGTWVTPG